MLRKESGSIGVRVAVIGMEFRERGTGNAETALLMCECPAPDQLTRMVEVAEVAEA